MAKPQNRRFSVKQATIETFAKNVSNIINIGISPGFWLIIQGNDISIIGLHRKFQDHIKGNFFKMVILNFLRWQPPHPPPTHTHTPLHTPVFGGLPYSPAGNDRFIPEDAACGQIKKTSTIRRCLRLAQATHF